LQTTTTTQRPKAKNCKEVIDGKLQVQWEIQKDSVVIELYGRIREDQYMAFGLSGANGRSQMVNGDVVVAFYDVNQLRFRVEDYYISHLSQCDGKQGVCPDERIGGKNDAVLSKH
jgi:DOMON domain